MGGSITAGRGTAAGPKGMNRDGSFGTICGCLITTGANAPLNSRDSGFGRLPSARYCLLMIKIYQ
jgi:hypothetical protein